MKLFKFYMAIIGLVFLSACVTTPSDKAAAVSLASNSQVQGCEFLGIVIGTSQWGMTSAVTGIQNAKHEAREHAVQLKATHIVWQSAVGGISSSVVGKAYLCARVV